ncbi:MAG TPA: SDR family oxidoreductase [Kineosporiaceae bacterium]|nr:SDR family oxidoreductase [Kineosporiaceae bacterium]
MTPDSATPVALVTGGSQGLGLALTRALAASGWRVVVDARHSDVLDAAVRGLAGVTAVAGDVADPGHRAELAAAVAALGRLDLLVHNASSLGPSPLPTLATHPVDELERIYAVNVLAPLALTQLLLDELRATHGTLITVSSDAAVEAYPGWGGYGSSKAALDQLAAVLAAEHPDLHVYAVDPGDMNTAMHQRAFPGEDISDRPDPQTVVPALLRLVRQELPSGRHRAADLLAAVTA